MGKPTDTRQIARETQRRLALSVVFFLVVVGTVVIAFVYGVGAAVTGLACLLAGAAAFGLLYGIVALMERWAGREP